uniref:DIX domain-containing protein n=1 Tax=Mucochytrium quahogii TaxID=96639 RepID=A0A7S2RG08_9STRA|mmetsp:Transcript_10322/g.16854  ORF Transcript_10322/g.16854 Transcript_10322/m.16854 type:complete len:246 (-) Transcript_10322:160-897(-)
MSRTAIYYFVPEDGDEEDHPNVFTISRPSSKVRLGDVKKTFPLPGRYHFRFKKAFKNTFVWLDILDDYDVVPRFEGQLVAKVSRTSANMNTAINSHHSAQKHMSSHSAASGKHISSAGPERSQSSTPPPRRESAMSKSSSGDLLGLGLSPVSPPTPPIQTRPLEAAPASIMGASNSSMEALDWSSVPSPSPSPPLGGGMRPVSPMKNGTPIGSMPRSSSPARTGPTKQKVQMTSDLSSAAKDFRL